MASLDIYLSFNGNCEEAFDFYKSVFGGDFNSKQRFKDMPPNPEILVSESDQEKIMHVSLPINKHSILMGSDTGGEWAASYKQGNNFSISINAESKEEANRLFNALSKNGKIIMPMEYTFWNSYFGMFKDQYGIGWMVSFNN